MKCSDLTRVVTFDDTDVSVSIGDIVWWFSENQIQNLPHAAMVVKLGDDNMVDLSYNAVVGSRLVTESGVCMVGDSRLANANYRKRGSWCPRGTWSILNLK